MRRRVALLCVALLSLCVVACEGAKPDHRSTSGGDADRAGERPVIVTTTGMVTDLVRRIAGERAEVIGLMGEGVDPHLYKPTRRDIERLLDADIVFYNGLLLEGKMTDALVRVASAGRPVYAVTELIDESMLLEPESFEGHADPHVWMDPVAWSSAIDAVERALTEEDPTGAPTYAANAAACREDLAALHAAIEQAIATIPEQQRVLVTAHDAFHYFGRRYGLEVVGILGISTDSEAGVRDIERIVDLVVERGVPAVFIESTVSPRNIEALVAGAAARGHAVTIGGSLFSDAMGAPGTYEGTYVGMLDHNASTITSGLGGTVPAGGILGRNAP